MFYDVFDDVAGSEVPPSNDVMPTSSAGGDSTSMSDEDYISVCSLDDDVKSSRRRCLSTSLVVSAGPGNNNKNINNNNSMVTSAGQCISVSTDRIWNCVLSMANQHQDGGGVGASGCVVRCSRSQENYIDTTDMICVDITIDEQVASSVDALHYLDIVVRSSRDIADLQLASNASGPLKSRAIASTGDVETTAPNDEVTTCDDGNRADEINDVTTVTSADDSEDSGHDSAEPVTAGNNDTTSDDYSEDSVSDLTSVSNDLVVDDVVDGEPDVDASSGEPSISRVKDADRPSAARLAKRLYHLDGFRRSDIPPHLNKKNSFSQLVGEEYLKYFDFADEQLDRAFRRFLQQVTVAGDSQECDRLLGHFSRRYHQCNPTMHKSEDSCHTLVCAMMLLNNNLHVQKLSIRRMTLLEFISNLAEMNGGEDFPKDVLKAIYTSIKAKRLVFTSSDNVESLASVVAPELLPPPTTHHHQTTSLNVSYATDQQSICDMKAIRPTGFPGGGGSQQIMKRSETSASPCKCHPARH